MINEFLLLYSHRRAAHTHTHTYHTIQKEKKKERTSFRVRAKKRERMKERKQEIYFHAPIDDMWFCLTPHLSLSNRVYAGVFIDSLVKMEKDK